MGKKRLGYHPDQPEAGESKESAPIETPEARGLKGYWDACWSPGHVEERGTKRILWSDKRESTR